jgi:hypothetical protein
MSAIAHSLEEVYTFRSYIVPPSPQIGKCAFEVQHAWSSAIFLSKSLSMISKGLERDEIGMEFLSSPVPTHAGGLVNSYVEKASPQYAAWRVRRLMEMNVKTTHSGSSVTIH